MVWGLVVLGVSFTDFFAWVSEHDGGRKKKTLTDPLVVWLVNVFVNAWVVLQTMNPIDAKIVESHVRDCREHQKGPAIVAHIAIEQAVATNLGQEPRQGQDVDDGHGAHRRVDLLANLILQEARVVLEPPVVDEVVGKRAKDKVKRGCADLGEDEDRYDLAVDVLTRP